MIPKVPEDALPGGPVWYLKRLLSQPQSEASLLVRKWFGYELAWMGDEVCISKHGLEVDLETVCWRIQADSDKEHELYVLEMRQSM